MFSPIRNKKVYEQVIEQIQDMVIRGALRRGDKLPSERALSEQLQVSRSSVREALRALEVIGLIESRQGGGNYISDNFEKTLLEPLSVMFMLQQSKPEEIMELRRVLEIEAVSLAAKRINNEDAEDLLKLVESFKTAEGEAENSRIDKELHYKIAKLSGNFLLHNTLSAISNLIEYFIKDARASILISSENREVLLGTHEEICIAIAKHDQDKAVKAMKKHFELIEEFYLSSI